MATTTVKVAVRIRPPNAKEILSNSSECVRVVPNEPQVVVGLDTASHTGGAQSSAASSRSFTFDHVFSPSSTQSEVYNMSVAPLVLRFLEGFNSTTLAYGQTGSGKTWSMGTGLDSSVLAPEQRGIVPRAIHDMYDRLTEKKTRNPRGFEWGMAVSFLELYNEDLVDLLNPRPRTAGSSSGGGPTIREDSQGNIVWGGVREDTVRTPEELLSCLQRGSLCRTTGSTDMNASSSRSHAIFSVILRQQIWSSIPDSDPPPPPAVTDTPQDPNAAMPSTTSAVVDIDDEEINPESHPSGHWRQITSKFHFVDLAGSERLKRTNAEGDRKKEGISINQGLLALGNVISALGDESRKSSHVPYRDSKLTRMLQDSLGGNSQTLMLACVSPSDANYGETVSTLTYANRARNIRNRVVINQDFFGGGGPGGLVAEKEIKHLRSLVAELREEVSSLRMGGGGGGAGRILSSRPGTSGSVSSFAMQERQQMEAADMIDEVLVAKERERQILLQAERDMQAKLAAQEQEVRVAKFETDRLAFRCARLAERNRLLNKELMAAVSERDASVIELEKLRGRKVILAGSPGEIVSPTISSLPTSPTSPQPSVPSTSRETSLAMVASYNQTITDLRYRLAEANDRLAWYNEVFSELDGKKKETSYLAQVSNFDPELDVPRNTRLKSLSDGEGIGGEQSHERQLLKALQSDAEVGKVLSSTNDNSQNDASEHDDGTGNMRLYGLPRMATGVNKPSNLTRGTVTDEDVEMEDENFDGDDDEEEFEVSPVNVDTSSRLVNGISGDDGDRSQQIYMTIHKLQADLRMHQDMVDQYRREALDKEARAEALQAKISNMLNQIKVMEMDRDEALKKIMKGGKGGSQGAEKVGTAAVKARFDEKMRKMEAELNNYRKKLTEVTKSKANIRDESLSKQLAAKVDALKAEKAKFMKELKKESQKQQAKDSEIARLRRKERAAAEMAKKLERSNQLQRLVLKKKNEESLKNQTKLKNVMSLIKRRAPGSAGGSIARIEKPSGMISPTKRPRSRGKIFRSITPSSEEAVIQTLRLGLVEQVETREGFPVSPPANVRAKFKKQMMDKELATVVTFKLAELELNALKASRDRLFGEQKELLAERERIVAAEYEETGIWDPHKPQYMDERLSVMDMEIAMVNARVRSAEEEIRLGRAAIAMNTLMNNGSFSPKTPSSPPSFIPSATDGDMGWENAVNLLRSLDGPEMEIVATAYLEDMVELKVSLRNQTSKLVDREKAVSDLRTALETMRGAALQTAMEYRKEMEVLKEACERKVLAAMEAAAAKGVTEEELRDILQDGKKSSPATPRLQRMFDNAYGQGVVVVKSQERIARSDPNLSASVAAALAKRSPEKGLTGLRKESEGDGVGWEFHEDKHEMDLEISRREMAPAAAAALASLSNPNTPTREGDGKPPVAVLSLALSPARAATLPPVKVGFATPPRGQAAADAAAIAAAAAQLAKKAEDGRGSGRVRRDVDDEVLAMSDSDSDGFDKVGEKDKKLRIRSAGRTRDEDDEPDSVASFENSYFDTGSPTRGREMRRRAASGGQVAESPTQAPGSWSPSRGHGFLPIASSNRDVQKDEKGGAKRIVNVRRGPLPSSPRSSGGPGRSTPTPLDEASSGTSGSAPSVTGNQTTTSPTRMSGRTGRPTSANATNSSRVRSPSWTYGRESPTTGLSTSPRRKVSTPLMGGSNSEGRISPTHSGTIHHPPPQSVLATASLTSSSSSLSEQPTRASGMVAASASNDRLLSSGTSVGHEEEDESLAGWQQFGIAGFGGSAGVSRSLSAHGGGKGQQHSFHHPPSQLGQRIVKKTSKSSIEGERSGSARTGIVGVGENDGGASGPVTDVFTRLAVSHTLASQAKVIHRDKGEGTGYVRPNTAEPRLSEEEENDFNGGSATE
ncbi:hypothetical protein HDU76_000804 [Blyttiomyces sp. JEL0837]|nr:hypothetical protein HDU76_000804 [Blyttiomyces sp. JEL0837]